MKFLSILLFSIFSSSLFAQDSIRIQLGKNLASTERKVVYFVSGKAYFSKDSIPWRLHSNPTCVIKLKEKKKRTGKVSVVSIKGEKSGLMTVGSFRTGLCGSSGMVDTAIGYLIGANINEKARVRLTGNSDVEALDCSRIGDTRKIAVGPETIKRTLGHYVDLDLRDYRGIAVAAKSGGKPCDGRGEGKDSDLRKRNKIPSGSRVIREGTVR